jgi:hypothetical protein
MASIGTDTAVVACATATVLDIGAYDRGRKREAARLA